MGTLSGKTILVTGGTGSFGCAFIPELLLQHSPHKVIVYSRDEVKQAQMATAIRDDRVRFFIGDVRDLERLRMACHGVDVVVHAAALKRVDSCEYNPVEAVATNVLGTSNVIRAAIDCGARRVLTLSTDKASAPCTLYGATKLTAERLTLAANEYSGNRCKFSCTRYGNIAGSRGSVIPTWREAIARGEPLKIYDADATRFWMRQSEAVALVCYALENMLGGEVFIPQLRAFRVGDLATAMGAVSVEQLPARAHEKAHESLISQDELPYADTHGPYFVLRREQSGYLACGGTTSDKAPRMTVEELRAELDGM